MLSVRLPCWDGGEAELHYFPCFCFAHWEFGAVSSSLPWCSESQEAKGKVAAKGTMDGHGSCTRGNRSSHGPMPVLPWQSQTVPGPSHNLSNAIPRGFNMGGTQLSPHLQSSSPTSKPAETPLLCLAPPLLGLFMMLYSPWQSLFQLLSHQGWEKP